MAADVQEPSSSSSSRKDLDADQIQNLINMALSNAYDTVSSWLETPTAASIAAEEKLRISNQEFEKMVFRPARLGVGAIAPTASTPKDVYKLKHKLAGTKRKADEMDSAKGKGKAKQDVDEDDDEESKAQSVSKKPKLGGASGLLAFEPTDPGAKHKKKKKKKDKRLLDLGTIASPDINAASQSEDPGPSSTTSRTTTSEPSALKQAQDTGSIPETSREGSITERAEPATGPDEPEAGPSDIRGKKRKKRKKRKSSSGEQGSKSGVQAGVDGNTGKDGDQRSREDDGEEWLGISPAPPPPGSDTGALKPSIPTSVPTPDFQYATTHGLRIHRNHPPKLTGSSTGDMPTPNAAATTTSRRSSAKPSEFPPLSPPLLDLYRAETASLPTTTSDMPTPYAASPVRSRRSSAKPFELPPLSPPLKPLLDIYRAETASLPTLPNGDSSSPRGKKKKKRHHLVTQAQALDEQSSEATLVSSSDHTARMTSPRD